MRDMNVFPGIGDIYQQTRDDELLSLSMVVGVNEGEIVFGTGERVYWMDQKQRSEWTFIRNVVKVTPDFK